MHEHIPLIISIFCFKHIQRWILLTTPQLSPEHQDRKPVNEEDGINAYEVGAAPNEPPPAYYVETADKAV